MCRQGYRGGLVAVSSEAVVVGTRNSGCGAWEKSTKGTLLWLVGLVVSLTRVLMISIVPYFSRNPPPHMAVTSLASTWITAVAIDHAPSLLS